jgi:lipopolysaccharide transport system ATP-binding protein
MADIAIRIKSLGKQYRIGELQKGYKTIRETIMNIVHNPSWRWPGNTRVSSVIEQTIWALRDVSLEIKQGELLGIIGRNGAGKTTLLKILSRVTDPTQGRVELYGRVGSLLEVGTGFHPELTGRENIFLNGAIIGMKGAEIKRKFDEIVEFAEIGKFLDTPVKRYSSGMYVRLAFAVAAHLEPEILLVDEVLAVGDAAFQKKCLGKMGEVSSGGRTVLFVSHNMSAISQLCEQVLWLEGGQVVKMGATREIIQDYLNVSALATGTWVNSLTYTTEPEIKILSASVINEEGIQTGTIRFDENFSLKACYEIRVPTRTWFLLFRVTDSSGMIVFTSWDIDYVGQDKPTDSGMYDAICYVPAKLLRPGVYSVTLLTCVPGMKPFDHHESVFNFEVSLVGYTMNTYRLGVITPILKWSIERSSN